MSFGERLKKVRKDRGLTQQELARLIKVQRGAVALWETDKTSPSGENLKSLAEHLQVDMIALMAEPKPPKKRTGDKSSAYAIFNGLQQLVWGLKNGTTDPEMKEALDELEFRIRQIMQNRFEN